MSEIPTPYNKMIVKALKNRLKA